MIQKVFLTILISAAVLLNSNIVSAQEKPEIFVQMGHTNDVDSLVFSLEGRDVLSGSWDGTGRLWDVSTRINTGSVPMFYYVSQSQADNREIKPLKTWTGWLDESLRREYPVRKNFLSSQEELDKLWAAWRLPEKEKPAVDFSTQLILVGNCPCSHISMAPRLDGKGNLFLGVSITKDISESLSYIIVLIPRQGIRAVEGRPLIGDIDG